MWLWQQMFTHRCQRQAPPSQVPQPTLRSGLGERMPPERIIFLQRLLEPSICIVTPYIHTFLESAGSHGQLLLWQTLSKSILQRAAVNLGAPPVCHSSATSLSLQFFISADWISHYFCFRICVVHFFNIPCCQQTTFSSFGWLWCGAIKYLSHKQINIQPVVCTAWQFQDMKFWKFFTDDAYIERSSFHYPVFLASDKAEKYIFWVWSLAWQSQLGILSRRIRILLLNPGYKYRTRRLFAPQL